MTTAAITVPEQTDQEVVSEIFREHNLLAAPVVDSFGRMKGVVTVDDIVDVLAEEATEDVQKIGGREASSTHPTCATKFAPMVRKRGGLAGGAFLW